MMSRAETGVAQSAPKAHKMGLRAAGVRARQSLSPRAPRPTRSQRPCARASFASHSIPRPVISRKFKGDFSVTRNACVFWRSDGPQPGRGEALQRNGSVMQNVSTQVTDITGIIAGALRHYGVLQGLTHARVCVCARVRTLVFFLYFVMYVYFNYIYQSLSALRLPLQSHYTVTLDRNHADLGGISG